MGKLFNIQKVYNEFRQYDRNHDLKMDRKELEDALIKFYFKDVAKPGLIQTAAARAKVKSTVDAVIKRHDQNKDKMVEWKEFEMDAFMEEHYNLGAKCETSKTPLNRHEVQVVDNLIRKFKGNTKTKEMSHSMWYQITAMLTEQGIDAINGPAKGPALGCRRSKPGDNSKPPAGRGSGGGRFGKNGGKNFGKGKRPSDNRRPSDGQFPSEGRPSGPMGVSGGRPRILLARMLQQQPPGSSAGGVDTKTRMTVMEVLQALHKQADSNKDGKISDHEILDIFQGVRDHLTTSNFGTFLDFVNKLKGPVNCGKNTDCGKCTAVGNAGLCGWFAESQKQSSNPFGGYISKKSKGTCKFVDRSMGEGRNTDAYKLTTCSTQCKKTAAKKAEQGRQRQKQA